MKQILILTFFFSCSWSRAEEKMKMYFKNEELIQIIELYAKASKQKFVVDANVRGRVSIFLPEAVTLTDAFNQLSSALAVNGLAISRQGDTMVIQSARNIQRNYIEVSSEVPALKPERMYTWVYQPKNTTADRLNRDLRILSSKDGEMSVNSSTNQLILTDWVSNLNRINELLKQIDRPNDPATSKLVEEARKVQEVSKKEQ